MALITDLKHLLQTRFRGATVKLSRFPGDRIGGSLIWDGFDEQAQIDRQVRLREAVNDLPLAERQRVSFILTLTPDEQEAMAKS